MVERPWNVWIESGATSASYLNGICKENPLHLDFLHFLSVFSCFSHLVSLTVVGLFIVQLQYLECFRMQLQIFGQVSQGTLVCQSLGKSLNCSSSPLPSPFLRSH